MSDKKPLVMGHVGFAPSAAPGDGNANWIKAWRADLARAERERNDARADLAKAHDRIAFLEQRERDVCAAVGGVSDGGRYRNDVIEHLKGQTSDLAKAQARCVEMANALRKAEHAMCGAGGNGCFCRCPVIDGHGPGCELVAALASDGTSALASVRLAQRALDEVTGGAAIYGDGRLQDDMRAEILAAKAALAEAFGSGE